MFKRLAIQGPLIHPAHLLLRMKEAFLLLSHTLTCVLQLSWSESCPRKVTQNDNETGLLGHSWGKFGGLLFFFLVKYVQRYVQWPLAMLISYLAS